MGYFKRKIALLRTRVLEADRIYADSEERDNRIDELIEETLMQVAEDQKNKIIGNLSDSMDIDFDYHTQKEIMNIISKSNIFLKKGEDKFMNERFLGKVKENIKIFKVTLPRDTFNVIAYNREDALKKIYKILLEDIQKIEFQEKIM
jgi:hypothetical protein